MKRKIAGPGRTNWITVMVQQCRRGGALREVKEETK